MHTHLRIPLLDLAIIIAYLVGITAVGLLSTRKVRVTGSVFFLAGRSLKWWIVGAALFASNISTNSSGGTRCLGLQRRTCLGQFRMDGGLHAGALSPGLCSLLLRE